ncbi:MAG TPA: ATP-binding protein [Cyclobacteriaceae bacterium]|nr:ATP-binding protein [Cyclobacteriaceae bacterium]
MSEESNICPYTGLRSFTEEESLYFKGRDEQIDQVAHLLELNKFIMLTGASGEGKSSLIYAGLIPNARAGFFKARYTHWVISDFRPERAPVKNMAAAVAKTFGTQPATVETELRRGFSSLIDLYVNSSFYLDENEPSWKMLSESEQKNKTRSAANLLIIVDQFEEFFTNPENYLNETPSQDSQIVVNLALETARIALQRNLPVYVVCTMRSDYIGQCSAFRGLPEYIGFSQFFVPRLKRQEIKQVIEEPARLSGNQISKRLVERLVYDLADGIDQLPILQHALRQIWLAANDGMEEMDLIHYAMVGGMSAMDLPNDQQSRYASWFESVPENQRKFYEQPGLNKVIEIHASRLYEGAWLYYNNNHPQNPITQKDAKRIIALTFACLTKIDDSRAVRNRMTLQEITHIINQTNITTAVTGGVLNYFRENNNSFIRPYKTSDEQSDISPYLVLDITHESLIRNWGLLNKWANQEFQFYSTFLDFKKQLNRWKGSGKDSGYLLPLGPLTYFENWYNQCKPNTYWIDRYSDIKNDATVSLKQSEELLADTKEFIRRSARKVLITRAFIKYGARRMATVFALTAILLFTGFYWYDARQKTNKQVEKQAIAQAQRLLLSSEVNNLTKATYLLTEERLNPGSLLHYLTSITQDQPRIELMLSAYRLILYFDKHSKMPLKTELTERLLSEMKAFPRNNHDQATFLLEQQNQFILLLAYDDYYNPSPKIADEVIPSLTGLQHELIGYFFSSSLPYKQLVATELNLAIQLWLTFGHPSVDQAKTLVAKVTPFADDAAREVFKKYYVKGNYEANGRIPSDYNGGYHTVASLYAAAGDADGIIKCFEFLPETYFRSSLFNNYNNLLGFLYQYQHTDQVDKISRWLFEHFPSDDPLTVYRNTIIRSGYITPLYGINLIKNFARSNSGYFHINLSLGKREQFFDIVKVYEQLATAVKDPNERNYLLAMHFKRVALLYSKYLYDRGMPMDPQIDQWLSTAWQHFRQINEEHLNVKIPVTYRYLSDGVRNTQTTRRNVFLYPDYRDGWFANKFNTDVFIRYAIRNNLLKEYYDTPETINLIHDWISSAHEYFLYKETGEATSFFQNDFIIPSDELDTLLSFTSSAKAHASFDRNLPLLILANRNFSLNDTSKGFAYFRQMDIDNLISSGNKYEYLSHTYFINSIFDLTAHLAVNGKSQNAMAIIGKYEPFQQAFGYAIAADELYKTYRPESFVFLDSAYSTINRVDFNNLNSGVYDELDARRYMTYVLGKIGGDKVNRISRDYVKELIEISKVRGTINMIVGTAQDGNYFKALSVMPPTLTEDQELICYYSILAQIARGQKTEIQWAGMDEALLWEYNYFLSPL